MSNQLLASKVIVQEERPAVRQIPTLDTLVMSFAGVTEKGPVNEPVLVESFTDYVAVFGSYIAASDMTASVEGFFENGGTNAYVVRVVHYTDITNAATNTSDVATVTLETDAVAPTSGENTSAAGPYDLEPSQTLVIKIDGGGNQTFTFAATAAARTTANTETYDLADGQTLTVSINGGSVQTITFNASAVANIDAVTAEEAAAIINGVLAGASATVIAGNTVRITSDRRGTASGVNVTGGSANAALGFTTGNIAGTGDVADIDAVTATEVVSKLSTLAGATASVSLGAVRIVSSTTGASSSVQVTNASTATDIGFDNVIHSGIAGGTVDTLQIDGKYDGTYANDYSVKIAAATSGEASEFNLDVLDSTGLVLESWPNLTMDSTAARYVEDVISEGSTRISAIDLEAAGTATQRRPVNVTADMAGGDDGLVGLADSDYVGSSASATGLRALDTVDDLTLLAVPGIATSAVHNAMITYCESTRGGQVFAVLDPPADMTASQIVTYVTSTAAIGGLTEYAAIYWPRIEVLNPNKTIFGKDPTIPLPPSGHIAGMYSRNDNAKPGGVWTQPAGTEEGRLFGVLGFEGSDSSGKHPVLKEEIRDLVFPKRINPITTMTGFPRFVDGARNLKGDGNWPSVGQRRGVSFAERSIKLGLQFARHKNNTPELRGDCHRTVFAFLKDQMDAGAFVTKDPATAYFVDFGDALNTVANKIVGRIGLATAQPAEYIVLKFSQDTRALDSASNS